MLMCLANANLKQNSRFTLSCSIFIEYHVLCKMRQDWKARSDEGTSHIFLSNKPSHY